MQPWLDHGDLKLYHGDCLSVLRGLPSASVDCVVTSPPYYGLRDYGTGSWEGGDPNCNHAVRQTIKTASSTLGGGKKNSGHQHEGYGMVCGRCGARRIDQQIGLEESPAEFVGRLVEVFREIHRALADHGSIWLNLGDTYAANRSYQVPDNKHTDVGNSLAARVPSGFKPKDLMGMPWRVALALQDDGWFLRSDIIWAKPNPLPESIADRPTKAHEYVFLLTKRADYYFDQEAVREKYSDHPVTVARNNRADSGAVGPKDLHGTEYGQSGAGGYGAKGPDGRRKTMVQQGDASIQHRDGERWPNGGRNIRSVWWIPAQPYPEAHFATFPEEIPRRCILAGSSEKGVCVECGKPWERVTTESQGTTGESWHNHEDDLVYGQRKDKGKGLSGERFYENYSPPQTIGWQPTCSCGAPIRPAVVLDPFVGSGTTLYVARNHGRHGIGIDLNEDYLKLAQTRLQQLSLLTTY